MERLLRICDNAYVVVNEGFPKEKISCQDKAHWVEITTGSPLESLAKLLAAIPMPEDGKYLIITSDSLFAESKFKSLFEAVDQLAAEKSALVGVTEYVNDEKPLLISADPGMRVHAIDDEADSKEYTQFVGAGVYAFSKDAVNIPQTLLDLGKTRLRDFQKALLYDGFDVTAFNLGKAYDIDRPEDLFEASAASF